MPFRAGFESSQLSHASSLPSGDHDPVPQPTFSVGSAIGNGVYPVPSALTIAGPIRSSLSMYGTASLLPSGDQPPQQLFGASTVALLPSGFEVKTDWFPLDGSIRSNVICP